MGGTYKMSLSPLTLGVQELVGGLQRRTYVLFYGKVGGKMILVGMWVVAAWKENRLPDTHRKKQSWGISRLKGPRTLTVQPSFRGVVLSPGCT